jgi:hypothetical protein
MPSTWLAALLSPCEDATERFLLFFFFPLSFPFTKEKKEIDIETKRKKERKMKFLRMSGATGSHLMVHMGERMWRTVPTTTRPRT